MSSNPLHEYKHDFSHGIRHRDARHRPHIPPIPDLRFELTFLRSIRPYLHFHRIPSAKPSEVIEVEWRHVLWVTVRDQVFSPLLQGTVWALVSFYLTPFSARVGHGIVERLPDIRRRKEGLGVGWLRNWVKSLGLSSSAV